MCATESEMKDRCLISSVFFSLWDRAAPISADTNKENVPLSGRSRPDSSGEDTGSGIDSQESQSGQAEWTPKPRKSKHSPTLVQLMDNQDAHADTVSHTPSLLMLTSAVPLLVFWSIFFCFLTAFFGHCFSSSFLSLRQPVCLLKHNFM